MDVKPRTAAFSFLTLLVGGLGGAVFTWYMNRPVPTVVTYRIASTTLAAPEAAGLIPNLKVLVGGNQIQALYAYNVEFLPRQGPYAEQLQVALSFLAPVHIYGLSEETPSDLHHMTCSAFAVDSTVAVQLPDAGKEIKSIHCMLSPILVQKVDVRPFRLTMATDQSKQPKVSIAARNIDLVAADQFEPKRVALVDYSEVFSVLSALAAVGIAVFFLTSDLWARLRDKR